MREYHRVRLSHVTFSIKVEVLFLMNIIVRKSKQKRLIYI